jgi:siderophore synthetase component
MQKPNKEIFLRLIQSTYRENLLSYDIQRSDLHLSLPKQALSLHVSGCQFASLGRLVDFDRVVQHPGAKDLSSYKDFYHLLRQECGEQFEQQYWDNFQKELENNEHNLIALKSLAMLQMKKTSRYSTLMEFVERYHLDNASLYFEQFSQSGHPYHPCHKTRLGFSDEELKKYSPEYAPIVSLYLAAIHVNAAHLENTSATKIKQFFKFHWPREFSEWEEATFFAADYVPTFIHPWQKENMDACFTDNKDIIVFENITVAAQPTLSFRTMDIKTEHGHVYCKLPVAIQATSAVRTVSPASVQNGPRISNLLVKIFENEPSISDHLRMLKETFGLHVNNVDDTKAKQLSMIMRDHASIATNDNERAIVMAALFETTPTTQLPLLFELMSTKLDDLWGFLASYFLKAINAFLGLYLLYGIALECHQQNTLLLLKDNMPEGFIIRDFGGVRIHLPRLNQRGYDISPYPNSATFSTDRREVRNKLIHTLYQIHFGEMINLFDRHLNFTAEKSWATIRAMTEKCFMTLKPRMKEADWQEDYDAILNQDWDFKCLMKMRLTGKYSDYIYSKMSNPLVPVTQPEEVTQPETTHEVAQEKEPWTV